MVHHGINIEVGKIANEISVSEECYDAIIGATDGKPIVPKFLDLKKIESIYMSGMKFYLKKESSRKENCYYRRRCYWSGSGRIYSNRRGR